MAKRADIAVAICCDCSVLQAQRLLSRRHTASRCGQSYEFAKLEESGLACVPLQACDVPKPAPQPKWDSWCRTPLLHGARHVWTRMI